MTEQVWELAVHVVGWSAKPLQRPGGLECWSWGVCVREKIRR